MRKFFQKRTTCRQCSAKLSGENLRLGFCDGCAEREVKKLQKRIRNASIGSVAILAVLLLLRHYACTASYIGEYGELIVPIWAFALRLKPESFYGIMYPSSISGFLIPILIVFAPFSSLVQIDYKTHRHSAEQQLSGGDPLVYRYAIQSNQQRTDDVGLFIFSVCLAVVSGPFFFVYRLYKWRQLSGYLKKKQES